MKHAVRDGNLIREDEAVLPVTRREVFFNFSVYESLKVSGGVPLFAEEHIERFFDSARILELSHPFSAQDIEVSIEKLVKADSIEEGTVKLLLVGGEEPLYIIYAAPLEKYSPELYSSGIEVITYPGERVLPRAKSNCLLLNYMAGREAAGKGALEALLVDRKGMVTEGTRSNLFAVTPGGELVTAEEDVLYGVTRKHILEIADSNGIDIRLGKIDKRDIIAGVYSELFISSTSMGALPVAVVDGEPVRAEMSGQNIQAGETIQTGQNIQAGKTAQAGRTTQAGRGAGLFPLTAFLHGELKKRENREVQRNLSGNSLR